MARSTALRSPASRSERSLPGRAWDRIARGVRDGHGDRVFAQGKTRGVEVAQVDGGQRGENVQSRRHRLST